VGMECPTYKLQAKGRLNGTQLSDGLFGV